MSAKPAHLTVSMRADVRPLAGALSRLWVKLWCIATRYKLALAPVGVLDICKR